MATNTTSNNDTSTNKYGNQGIYPEELDLKDFFLYKKIEETKTYKSKYVKARIKNGSSEIYPVIELKEIECYGVKEWEKKIHENKPLGPGNTKKEYTVGIPLNKNPEFAKFCEQFDERLNECVEEDCENLYGIPCPKEMIGKVTKGLRRRSDKKENFEKYGYSVNGSIDLRFAYVGALNEDGAPEDCDISKLAKTMGKYCIKLALPKFSPKGVGGSLKVNVDSIILLSSSRGDRSQPARSLPARVTGNKRKREEDNDTNSENTGNTTSDTQMSPGDAAAADYYG